MAAHLKIISNPAPTTYAGDITPADAWQSLAEDSQAVLVDVRTQPEWLFVGLPDLSKLEKRLIQICWQVFPTMARNANFLDEIKAAGIGTDQTILLLCRSGVRSKAAAEFLTAQGFGACYNIADGFEGQLDENRRRGKGGWKASGLPWIQG